MRKSLASVAVATGLLVAACGDDGDSPGLGGGQTPPPSMPEVDPSLGDSSLGDAGEVGDTGAGGPSGLSADEQAFCDGYTAMGPNSMDWDIAEAASLAPPPEIADAYQSILDGTGSLSADSEVIRWVTDHCF